ncbi:MAG: iron-sulfur cluster assembly accessory protein [Proteobacteria bacterium]|nr:iron-sulfur cluster assembly accessory protein [Pseudomonadota bacterium]
MENQQTPTATPKSHPAAFSITENAAQNILRLARENGAEGKVLLVGVKTKGCSGLSYDMRFAVQTEVPPGSETVTQSGISVAIDPKAAMFLFGTVMDYNESDLQSGFTFSNPNETGRCGCGESFTVDTTK